MRRCVPLGEHAAVDNIATSGLVKPFGAALGDDVDDAGDAADGRVIKRPQIRNGQATGEPGSLPRLGRCVCGHPTAKAALPTSVFDVFAFAKDGVNPGLFDRHCFNFAPAWSVPLRHIVIVLAMA